MTGYRVFNPGDFLVFQIESGFGILRVLDSVEMENERIWHVSVYRDFYMEVESAEASISRETLPALQIEHLAITERAFDSTQVSFLKNRPLEPEEIVGYQGWKLNPDGTVSDRSIRLHLGLR